MTFEEGKEGMTMETEQNAALEQHLLFHKALVDDSEANDRIDHYMEILEDSEGERMTDPVDESIRAAFSLVLEHDMDPWGIDLREFVRLYSEKVRMNTFDMIVAGKLVLMAWRILRLQSDATVASGERVEEQEWDEFPEEEIWSEEDPLHIPDVTLREAHYRFPVRPVTVMELLDAFEEAREEMEISAERERVRRELKAKQPRTFDNKAHDEDDERDVEMVWERIRKLGTGTLPLSELYTDNITDNITAFFSVLQLVRDGKLNVWQDELPYGEIFMEIKVDWASGTVEDIPQETAVTQAVM